MRSCRGVRLNHAIRDVESAHLYRAETDVGTATATLLCAVGHGAGIN